ncbi:MAG: hypothetical protein HOV76_06165 [Hamadaea sp.]|nr:hypothetical protein [Hamadaea sp.]
MDDVRSIRDLPEGVSATVQGNDVYRVVLRHGRGLDGACSCPFGSEGNFCKHLVAVGLRLLADDRTAKKPALDIHAHLSRMSQAELVELVWRRAQTDADLYQELRLAAAVGGDVPDSVDLSRLVESFDVEWLERHEVRDFADAADEVLTALGDLAARDPMLGQQPLQRAVELLSRAISRTDDEIGYVDSVAERAVELYLDACRAAPPDQIEFARWLLGFRLAGPDYQPQALAAAYDLLDDVGWTAFREGMDQNDPRSWQVRSLREELLTAADDIDGLVRLWSGELTGSTSYARIAKLLQAHGRVYEAMMWFESGIADGHGTGWAGAQLVDPLADLYANAGRLEDRLTILERYFHDEPAERTYQRLREAAEAVHRWPAVRREALARLQDLAGIDAHGAADTWARILLAEGEDDQAWRVIAKHTCREATVVAVADRRAVSHPSDAIDAYEPLIAMQIMLTNNDAYRQAAEYLVKVKPLFQRAHREFAAYVGDLREQHRRKRNFLAELGRRGL